MPKRNVDTLLFTALLIIVGILAIFQLVMGASFFVLVLSLTGLFVSLAPMLFWGRDIYTLVAAIFGARYVGAALLLKTGYGQALDENLQHPLESYALAALLLTVVTLVISAARFADRGGKGLLPKMPDGAELRRLALIAFSIGMTAAFVVGMTQSRRHGIASGGPVYVLASQLATFVYLGLAGEARHRLLVTDGKDFVSRRLIFMIVLTIVPALLLSVRSYVLSGIIGVAAVGFLYRAIRVRHLVAGAAAAAIVLGIVSPVMLALRESQYGATAGDFLSRSGEAVSKALLDPSYAKELGDREKQLWRADKALVAYDYFGDRSNIPNRLALVALLDAVYGGTQRHEYVGWDDFRNSVPRVIPRFLFPDKPAAWYQHGDWLSWNMGMSEPGRTYAALFSLPMEGYASFGLAGLILLPIIFLFTALRASSLLSSLRRPELGALFLFTALQHEWIEGTSDIFLTLVLRDLPLFFVGITALLWLVRRRSGVVETRPPRWAWSPRSGPQQAARRGQPDPPSA